ncbi:ENTH/VHS/GAT family protein [Trifolium repens]|nr:ENTH/VHS/GAT family protein [Trifolium repens]
MMAVSSSSASVAVEKATSDLLMGPDWTMNIEICDSINSNHWQPKDVVKAVKKRLQHRSSKVQILALTLLETMVKNCGDYVHFQITERNILEEMIKIVRKKADMQVRDKILVLLDSWQEAFGGAGGKYPQYYWAYEELRRSGVSFPKRSPDAAPIFTPPPTHPSSSSRNMQPGYGMPSSSSKTLDETMATEIESLSMSSLESMRHVLDLLSDMLQAVNPNDRAAVKDEVIVDLVDRCRTNQKKLMQMLTTTGDEELLGRGLELNDSIQSLLARHDAIASGASFPSQGASSSTISSEGQSSVNQIEVKSPSPAESSTPKASPPTAVYSEPRGESDEEEEDEFAQLARRHSKTQSATSKDATIGSSENSGSMNTNSTTPYVPETSTSIPSNALALPDPPAPISTTSKDQDIIDLLSITLSLAPSSPPPTTYAPSSAPTQGSMHQIPVPSSAEGYSYSPQSYPGNLPFNSYVAPWAQPQSKSEFQTQPPQQMYQSRSQPTTPPSHQHVAPWALTQPPQQMYQSRSQPTTPPSPQQLHAHYQSEQVMHHQHNQQPQSELPQSQLQNQHLQYNPQQHNEPQPSQYQPQHHPHLQPQHRPHLQQPQPQPQLQIQSAPQPQPQPPMQLQSQQSQPQPQYQNQHAQYPASYPPPPWAATPGYANYQSHLSAQNAISTSQVNSATASYPPAAQGVRPLQHNHSFSSPAVDPRAGNSGQRPFVPSYRLFEDLNVFGNTDGRVSGTSSNVSGAMGPGMVGGGRK